MKTLIEQLPSDKIKMNWNKKPIQMSKFLSFLTVDVMKCKNHPGADNGWTKYEDCTIDLIITGGLVNTNLGMIDFLDTIQYGKNLQNRFNNYCNPFYLLDIMNEEGKLFFLDYYKEDIDNILDRQKQKITSLYNQYTEAQEYWLSIECELGKLNGDVM